MANFFKDNKDLQWYVDHGIEWSALVETVEVGFRQPDGHRSTDEAVGFYRDVMELVGDFAANEIAPKSAEIDKVGVRLEDGEVHMAPAADKIMKKIAQLGLHGVAVPRSLGGMNCPLMVYMLNSELLARADVSLMAHIGFHGGMATAMMLFSVIEGSAELNLEDGEIKGTRFDKEIAEIVAGKAWASMDLTEPNAGSDLAKIRTKGEQDADGNWFVTGQKIFITSGHAKYHFVLARTEPVSDSNDPMAGLKGLSMFLVPAFSGRGKRKKWHATFERVEEKLGHHASPTVAINYERSPAQLIGERGEGFRYMLFLMNNARLAVAFESLGICEAAYRMARDYAAERPSMGKTIDKHELIAEYLDEMRTDIQALRAIAIAGTYHEELAQRYRLAKTHLAVDDEMAQARYARLEKAHKRKARALTPLCKYFGSEKAVEMGRQAVQIHGGVGYTTEYGAEKLLRDAMVMPIYEGTSQIQALMAMKDTLGAIIKNPQHFARRIAQNRWRSLSARDPLERRVAKVVGYSLSAQRHLIQRTATDKLKGLGGVPLSKWTAEFTKNWDPKRDFAFAKLHAERLIKLLIDEAVVKALWAQGKIDATRLMILERYLERAELRGKHLLERITTTGDRLLATLEEDEASDATG